MSFPSPREFFDQFQNDLEVVRRTAFTIGQEMGQVLKQRYNIQGQDLEAVAEILNAAMRTERGEHSISIENNKVTMCNTGFCPVMDTALTFDVNWEWLDTNFAWPWLEGIVSLIRSDIQLKIPTARCRGDAVCMHIFEIK